MTSSASQHPPRVERPLHDGWRVRAASGPVPDSLGTGSIGAAAIGGGAITAIGAAGDTAGIPAVVPGVVHLDLMRAGLIPDPYLDDHESALAWIGLVDWTYETTFELTHEARAAASVHELVFDGLDTVATVSLNGVVIAEVANQHRTHRIDVTALVRDGDNELVVAFRSPVKYANAQSLALGARPRPYPTPFDAIRKSACSFGWDWGIATATSGIWRPVRLESWSTARLDDVLVRTEVDGGGGAVIVEVSVVFAPSAGGGGDARAADRRDADRRDVPVFVSVAVAGPGLDEIPSALVDLVDGRASVRVDLEHVERWWPIGHGAQHRYVVDVRLHAGEVVDATHRVVGFRELRWNTEPDADGTPFQLVVNDRPVFVKGVNWIPDDAFPVRVDRARYRERLEQAASAGLNLVRVWGGGIYESDDFYDLCDELGLLTWQDFLFACSAYAEEEPLRSEVAAEARDNIVRLAHHPSLALLTGNNENLWGYEDWGWKLALDGRTWGAYYYHELFPKLVAEHAPHVPYAPGSPFSPGGPGGEHGGEQGGEHPNAEAHGTMHVWDLWNQQDWPHYRDLEPRFVAEFGWQGPPAWSTLTRAISDDPLTPESPGMIVHQKATDGNAKLTAGLVPHYRVPNDMETWHWAMQLNQANAISCALDHYRSHWPKTAGAVVWQLNDCWPVTSWAAIDGDGHAKPLFHAIRNAFAPRVVSIQPRVDASGASALAAVLGNDADDGWVGEVVFERRGFDGSVLARAAASVEVAARSSATVAIPVEVAQATDAACELLVASLDGVRGLWWFAEPRDSALAAADVTVETASTGAGVVAVTVTAGASVVRDLTLLFDKLDVHAAVDSGLVTLLPGESWVFTVSGVSAPGVISAEAVSDPRVLRSGNQLVAPPA
ncbi:glycosyl hydrolase 2 galactose-binding domain-containing protein [Agromyces aureus]|uniref:beta-mannosidase n=1 Tax=Agromyces aureus TaxID=453304 RepID=A0A191WCL2_9MICO|nr:beta-mannosidase [Agromyces aureus]ANJ26001.1 beta-mannosidase [Agromyces aureus]